MRSTPQRHDLPEVWMELHANGRKLLANTMRRRGISRRELATAAGWDSHTYMNRLVNGQARGVKPEAAARISNYLNLGLDDLFVVKSSSDLPQQGKGRAA